MDITNITCSNSSAACNITEEIIKEQEDNIITETYSKAIFQLLLFTTQTFLGLVGNSLVIYFIVRRKCLQTVCNFYLLNKAIAEVLFQLPNFLFFVTIMKGNFIFGYGTCILYSIVIQISGLISTSTLIFMAIDCYISSRHGHHSPNFRGKMMKISITCMWVLGAIFSKAIVVSEPYHLLPDTDYRPWIAFCLPQPLFFSFSSGIYFIAICMCYLTPLILIWVFLSLSITPKPQQQIQPVNENGGNDLRSNREIQEQLRNRLDDKEEDMNDAAIYSLDEPTGGREQETTSDTQEVTKYQPDYQKHFIKTLAILFTVCQLVFWLALGTHFHHWFIPFMYEFATSCFDLNVALNPLFYILHNKDLYQEFVRILPTRGIKREPLQSINFEQAINT